MTRPAKLEPPPVQPTMMSGSSSVRAICSMASRPMTVWWSSTWLSTLPSAYLVWGSLAATSTASEMAMPSEPLESGCWARMARPESVSSAGAGGDGCAEGFHQGAAVGLLVVADAHHVDLAFEAEELAGHGERGAPLAGAGFGGEAFGAFYLVVVGLRDGGVGLVRAGGADAFVLVVDVRGGIEGLLQAARAEERRGTPLRVDLADFAWDFDIALGADLLQDEGHGKERSEIVGADGLERAGVERRGHGPGQVGNDVVPGLRGCGSAADCTGWFPCATFYSGLMSARLGASRRGSIMDYRVAGGVRLIHTGGLRHVVAWEIAPPYA